MRAVLLSLTINAIYWTYQPGEIFEDLANRMDELLYRAHLRCLAKPLYECNICMGGLYSLLIYPIFWGFEWAVFPTMIATIGLNIPMAAIIKYLKE